MTVVRFQIVWNNRAGTILPCRSQHQPMIADMAQQVSAKAQNGVDACVVCAMKKSGRCHAAHNTPSAIEAWERLSLSRSLGQAYPRQPNSSATEPPRNR